MQSGRLKSLEVGMGAFSTILGQFRQHYWLAGALGFALTSCADNDTSLFVQGVMAATPPSCEITADPGAAQSLRGTLDVAFRSSYRGALLVANQLTPRGDKSNLRTETQGFQIQGAEVRLTDAQGTVLDEFSVQSGGFVESNTAETPGYGITLVTLVPPERGTNLRDALESEGRGASRTVVANVRVFGETLGGLEITSGEYRYTIDVCFGCLVEFPPDALEAMPGEGPTCGGSAEGVTLDQCRFGQDLPIDCRQCSGALDLCISP